MKLTDRITLDSYDKAMKYTQWVYFTLNSLTKCLSPKQQTAEAHWANNLHLDMKVIKANYIPWPSIENVGALPHRKDIQVVCSISKPACLLCLVTVIIVHTILEWTDTCLLFLTFCMCCRIVLQIHFIFWAVIYTIWSVWRHAPSYQAPFVE